MTYRDREHLWHEALRHTVYEAGKTAREIAAELGLSPQDLSRMCAHPEDGNRRKFDLALVEKLMRFTQDFSLLETWAAQFGLRVVKEGESEHAKLLEKIDNTVNGLQQTRKILEALG